MVKFFLLVSLAGILVGAALKTTAGKEQQDVHRMSNALMVAGLVALFFAILFDKSF